MQSCGDLITQGDLVHIFYYLSNQTVFIPFQSDFLTSPLASRTAEFQTSASRRPLRQTSTTLPGWRDYTGSAADVTWEAGLRVITTITSLFK